MQRSRKLILAVGLVAAGLGASAGSASAAHCTDSGMPGNSDFSVHVRTAGHAEGAHQGWSSCVPQAHSGGR